MEVFVLMMFSLVLVLLNFNLSKRVQRCEQTLSLLKAAYMNEQWKDKKAVSKEKQERPTPPSPPPFFSQEKMPKETLASVVKANPATKKVIEQKAVKQKLPRKPFKIPSIIKENWMGVFGSIALVIGAVFFGLTAEIMQKAEVRVGIMIAVSFLFLGVSQKLKMRSEWTLLCGWLQSIAGAVILFATLGAAGIKGLQFIDDPIYGLCFLCLGISINMFLAMTTVSQGVASLHVILSIIAFCLVPQALVLLPIGALVASIGLTAAYRSKWDIHLLLIVIAFAIQNSVWTLWLGTDLLPWMHHLAIGCSLAVALIAMCVHYSKKYRSPKLEVLPLIAHITNWGLLTWNVWLHAQFFKWTPLLLGVVAVAGFVLARVARKKEINWLYYTDTLLSQFVGMGAIASMSTFSVKPLDIGIMILAETLVFNFLCRQQKESFLLRIGYCLQYLSYLITAHYTLEALWQTPYADQFPIYVRMWFVTALSWGFHTIGQLKRLQSDDLRFILLGQKDQKEALPIMSFFSSLFFCGVYFYGFHSLAIQIITLSVIGLVALWRRFKEDHFWNISLLATLAFIHVMSWSHLVQLLGEETAPSIISRADFLGVMLLDAILIFGNFLQLKLWKKNIHEIVIYLLGIQLGLITYVFTKDVSILLPGGLFLGYSVLALEIGRTVPSLFKYSEEVKLKIREGMTHIGLAFLIAFLSRFVTVHLQIDPIWHGISLRWITEAMGLLVFVYWIAFFPRREMASTFTRFCGDRLVEGCLGFITLSVFAEMPEVWRPMVWAIMAIGLLMGSLYRKWPKRLLVYSWMYLIASIVHVAFVTSSLAMPSLFFIEKHNIPTLLTVLLQLVFACIAHRSAGVIMKSGESYPKREITSLIPVLYKQPSLTILLPIFIGVGLMFAFNFEKTVLTLLWVGLTCVYLAVGLLVKSKTTIQIAMTALIFCSGRLLIFDLVQSDLSTRALVFIGDGSLMLGMSVLYGKYKHRVEMHESA